MPGHEFYHLVDTDGATALVGDASKPMAVPVAALASAPLAMRFDQLDERPAQDKFEELYYDTFYFILDATANELLMLRELMRCAKRGQSSTDSARNLGLPLSTFYHRLESFKEKFPNIARALCRCGRKPMEKKIRKRGI